MKCPDCNIDMEWGKVYLQGTFWGYIFHGWSYKHCYFDSFENNDIQKIKIIDNDKSKKSFYCKVCGMVIIPRKIV